MAEPSEVLVGQTALVTGAGSRGIGRAIALTLAAAGADVAIHAYGDRSAADELALEVSRLRRRAVVLTADLSIPAAARDLVRRAIAELGKLDIFVSNAGTVVRKPILECSDDEFDLMLGVNLKASFAGAQEAARHMVQRHHPGRIIMVSSINQQRLTREQVLYCATKGGVMQLARGLALELAPYDVTVNLIAPGTIETDFNRHLLVDPGFRKLREEPVPLRRLGSPEDIAAAALYLVSPGAAYVTGTTMTVDGGLSLV